MIEETKFRISDSPVIYIDSQRAHDLDREIALQKLYYRPEGYYRTVEKMHNASRIAGYNFSLTDIKNWLNKQITFWFINLDQNLFSMLLLIIYRL